VADPPHPEMSAARLDELQTQARYARQRYDLYKARAYGSRLTSPARMRELEREASRAEADLRFAKAQARGDDATGARPPESQSSADGFPVSDDPQVAGPGL
jgi:hypothetical protein